MLAAAQVINAIAARLSAQSLGSGGVRTSRTWPWSEAELPACRVFAADELVTTVTQEPISQHQLQVDVQYTCLATADLDNDMHGLAESGLQLLFAGALPYGLQLTGISRQTATEGEAAVGQITLQLQCLYFVAPDAPQTIIS